MGVKKRRGLGIEFLYTRISLCTTRYTPPPFPEKDSSSNPFYAIPRPILYSPLSAYTLLPLLFLPVAYREREKSEKEKGFRYLFTFILKKIKEEIVHSITANNETFNIDFDID